MTVFILEKVPESLRGELSRWVAQPRAGVFVGKTSKIVRLKLWKKIRGTLGPNSGALMIYSSPNEAGFVMESHGETSRRIRNVDGLQLVERDHPNPERARRKLQAKPPKNPQRRAVDLENPWRRPIIHDPGDDPS